MYVRIYVQLVPRARARGRAREHMNRSVSPPAAALGIMAGGVVHPDAACVRAARYSSLLSSPTYTSSSAWRDNISGLDWLPSSVQVKYKYRQLLLCIEFYHLHLHAVQTSSKQNFDEAEDVVFTVKRAERQQLRRLRLLLLLLLHCFRSPH